MLEWIYKAFQYLRDIWSEIIEGILSFTQHIVGWFHKLVLNPKKDVPFIGKMDEFRTALKSAPTKNVGIFKGVYNEETEQIDHIQYIDADEIDEETRNTLGKETLVVLN